LAGSLSVITFATEVGVGCKEYSSGLIWCHLIELGIQDIPDALVGSYASGKSTSEGSFETLVGVSGAEAENTHTGAIGLLRMFS